jgi:hypothetical protein
VLSFACPECPAIVTSDRLAARGWYTSRIADPLGLHMTLTPVHDAGVDAFLADLEAEMKAPAFRAAPVEFLTY